MLYGIEANLEKGKGDSKIRKDDAGIIDWLRSDETASWEFSVAKPGTFDVAVGLCEGRKGSGRARKVWYEGGWVRLTPTK